MVLSDYSVPARSCRSLLGCLFFASTAVLSQAAHPAKDSISIRVVSEANALDAAASTGTAGLYQQNRAPLHPALFIKLPLGSITPGGWLRQQLDLDASGIPGRFEEISKFLNFDETGWVQEGKRGWEELPYWLRGYVSLAYTLKDEQLTANAKKWVEAILATCKPDGYFGPENLRSVEHGKAESFPHQCMIYVLRSYYEATGEKRALDAVVGFYRWLSQQPDMYFKSGWGAVRWSEHLYGVYWAYNQTGEAWLLDLAKRIHETTANWTTIIPTAHNVNFAQGFREPGLFWLQAKDPSLLKAVNDHYQSVMDVYGQFPGGGFAGDEGRRFGYIDPRQGFETCGYIEFMLSDEIMTRITGDPVWADRCEEIAFNSLPAAVTADHRALHYITSANSVQLDKTSKKLNQFCNGPFPMQAFEPSPHNYRCCPHNLGMGWPYYTESLCLATADGGLCASLYASCKVKAKVGKAGTEVTLAEETEYPFGEVVKFKLSTPKPVRFPLYLRVPRWCENATLSVNGTPVQFKSTPLSYVVVERVWADGDRLTWTLPMRLGLRTWAKQANAVSVDFGPLTFSLDIAENTKNYDPEKIPNPAWQGTEFYPGSAWNYGLALEGKDPAKSIEIVRKPCKADANPFTKENAPITLKVRARKIEQWKTDQDGVVGPLQKSPALTKEPVETVKLIPMGVARLRITCFPTVTTDAGGQQWQAPARSLVQMTSSFIEPMTPPMALTYGLEPASSNDESRPLFTWWNKIGSRQWLRYKFPKPVRVSAVTVYWFDDKGQKSWYAGSSAFAVPQSWTLEYHDGNTWKPVKTSGSFGLLADAYNRVEFEPVSATSLRLMVQLQPGKSAGLYAWKVFDGQTQLVPTASEAAEKALTEGVVLAESQEAPVADSWFKPDGLKDITDGQSVQLWRDEAASGSDAGPALGGTLPTVVKSVINGQAVIHCEGAKNQFLSFARNIEDDLTIAVVFRAKEGVGTGKQFWAGAGIVQGKTRGNDTADFGISMNARGEVLAGTGKPHASINSAPGFNDGKAHVALFTREKATGALGLYVDGKPVATGKGSTESLTESARIGIGGAIGYPAFTGDIGEVIVYGRALSEGQRKPLEEELMTRWGIEH